jgi:CxxC motif-containing protein
MKKESSISKICLACPHSCNIRPQIEGQPGRKLCPKGLEFLAQEQKDPKRHYFSTFRDNENKIQAYRTVETISLQAIEKHCERLNKAASAKERNLIHKEFCLKFKVKITCIDLES